jgi:hypothetical protein
VAGRPNLIAHTPEGARAGRDPSLRSERPTPAEARASASSYTVIQSSAQRCEESPENREVAMRSAEDASAAARPLHDSILGRFRVHMWDDALALLPKRRVIAFRFDG